MKNHVLTGIVIFVLVLSVFGFAYTGGNGTSTSPYQIADADDLLELASDTANYDKCFILTADINLTGHNFTKAVIAPNTIEGPDFEGDLFVGVFDGNYHVISNLTINTLGQDHSFLGLFGNTFNATIKKLGLENVSVTGSNTSYYISTLIGTNQSGTVDQCYAMGTVYGGSSSVGIGGLLNAYVGQITNCYADVDVYAVSGARNLGGLAGVAQATFSNCYAGGFVDSRVSSGGFGGLTHPWFTLILNCYYLDPADGGGPNNSVATVLTDAQMRLQSSFITWDFQGSAADGENEVWHITNGYPLLNWQVPVGMRQLAVLSRYWDMTGCTSSQPCAIADWYDDDTINTADLELLIESWLGHGMKTDYPKTTDDFETGDFTALPWLHSGDATWTIVSGSDVYAGTYSAKSGTIGHSQSSSLELTANVTGDSEIVFAVKVSSESGFDGLTFYIDGSARLMGYSGQHDWTEISFSGFGTGTHTFKWSYTKDSGGIGGSDSVWLDNIRILRLE